MVRRWRQRYGGRAAVDRGARHWSLAGCVPSAAAHESDAVAARPHADTTRGGVSIAPRGSSGIHSAAIAWMDHRLSTVSVCARAASRQALTLTTLFRSAVRVIRASTIAGITRRSARRVTHARPPSRTEGSVVARDRRAIGRGRGRVAGVYPLNFVIGCGPKDRAGASRARRQQMGPLLPDQIAISYGSVCLG